MVVQILVLLLSIVFWCLFKYIVFRYSTRITANFSSSFSNNNFILKQIANKQIDLKRNLFDCAFNRWAQCFVVVSLSAPPPLNGFRN